MKFFTRFLVVAFALAAFQTVQAATLKYAWWFMNGLTSAQMTDANIDLRTQVLKNANVDFMAADGLCAKLNTSFPDSNGYTVDNTKGVNGDEDGRSRAFAFLNSRFTYTSGGLIGAANVPTTWCSSYWIALTDDGGHQFVLVAGWITNQSDQEQKFLSKVQGSILDPIAAAYPDATVIYCLHSAIPTHTPALADLAGFSVVRDGTADGDWILCSDADMATTATATVAALPGAEDYGTAGYTALFSYSATYTVTFTDYNGDVLSTQSVAEGGAATAPTAPSRPGFTFTGWDTAFDNVTGNLTVVAQYEVAGDQHIVSFLDWNEELLEEIAVADGGTAAFSEETVREGWHFTGWLLDGEAYDLSTPVTADLTLVADYAINVYTVTFEDWNGQALDSQPVEHGSAAEAPVLSDFPEGKVFFGWDTPFDSVTSDLTVRATLTDAFQTIATAAEFVEKITVDSPAPTTYVLTADIDLADVWTAIPFAATLDGQGHAISGLTAPLFTRIEGGTVENLVIDGATITSTSGGNPVGTLAQYLSSGGMVSNCTTTADCTVRAHSAVFAGGLIGILTKGTDFAGPGYAGIYDCTNYAAIVKTSSDNNSKCGEGGIVGKVEVGLPTGAESVECHVERCANYGAMTSAYIGVRLGGIVGFFDGQTGSGTLVIADCANEGSISCTSESACTQYQFPRLAGILAVTSSQYYGNLKILRCVNRGTIDVGFEGEDVDQKRKAASGILAVIDILSKSATTTLESCANYGEIRGEMASGLIGIINVNGNYSYTQVVVENCANYGAITGVEYAAQAVGRNNQTNVARTRRIDNGFFLDPASSATPLIGQDPHEEFAVENIVRSSDDGYQAAVARRALNAVAEENGWPLWVNGRLGPELSLFAEEIVPATLILLQ